MKILDRNGRLFGKISLIDVLVVAAVAVMGVALFQKTNTKEITSTVTKDVPFVYTVKVTALRNYIKDSIAVGDLLFDSDDTDTGGSLGRITNIEYLPSERLETFHDGTVKDDVSMPDSANLMITVEASGQIQDGVYMLNRIYPLGINASRNFCTKYAQFTGVVQEFRT